MSAMIEESVLMENVIATKDTNLTVVSLPVKFLFSRKKLPTYSFIGIGGSESPEPFSLR